MLCLPQLAEISLDNVLASEHYKALLDCLLDEAAEHSMIPRKRRWELAEAYNNLGRVQSRQGGEGLEQALESITQALSYSPVETQRRSLFADLGDLYLAKGDVENSVKGYHSARDAVRSKGGNIDTKSWSVKLSDFSVGGGLTKVLGEDFLMIRSRVILGRDSGDEWDQLISDWTSRVGEVSKDLECREDEDLVEMEKGKKFCKKYIRHANVNVPIKKEEEDDDEIDAAKNENDREEL